MPSERASPHTATLVATSPATTVCLHPEMRCDGGSKRIRPAVAVSQPSVPGATSGIWYASCSPNATALYTRSARVHASARSSATCGRPSAPWETPMKK